MKTRVQTTVESETRKVEFGYWVQEDDEGEFFPLQNENDYRQAVGYLGCSTELLDMMSVLHDSVLDAIGVDLVDIWERLDKMEQD